MNKLYEYRTHDQAQIVVEQAENGKSLCMSGLFIQGDVRNHNKRVYPVSEIRNAVSSLEERISETGGVPGELDHPEELSINLDRVSHLIVNMWLEGSDGHGKLKIIDTPMGNIVKTLIQSGVKLGVSSRGSGNVNHDGAVSDFEIVTVDIVAQPSAPNAYPKTIYESLFNMRGGSRMFETAQDITHSHTPNAQKYLGKELLKLIDELGKQ